MPVSGEFRGMTSVKRNTVVSILGTPDGTVGSLNSPIELDENGIHFNEKWIYEHLHDDPAGVPMRVVYWHRYDFMGTLVRENSGAEWRADDKLIEACEPRDSRLVAVTDSHVPQEGQKNYRPVSRPRDSRDLGGYV